MFLKVSTKKSFIILILAVGVVFLFRFFNYAKNYVPREYSEPSLSEFEQFIGYNIPEKSTDIHLMKETVRNDHYFVKFTTTSDSALDFFKSIGIEYEIHDSEYAKTLNILDTDWWDTKSHNGEIVATNYTKNNVNYSIGLLKSDPENWTVYIIVFKSST